MKTKFREKQTTSHMSNAYLRTKFKEGIERLHRAESEL